MSIERKTKDRILQLIQQADQLSRCNEFGRTGDKQQIHLCSAWISSALNVVQLIISSPNNGYRKKAEEIESRGVHAQAPSYVDEFKNLLINLLNDIEQGLITDIADNARAETFDNFLDHAKTYAKEGYKNEAGVIAGVVFEDSLRRICNKHQIIERGIKLDTLISTLTSNDVLSQAKAKRARAAAHVRTKATHAQWEEFDLNDVNNAIAFTENSYLQS